MHLYIILKLKHKKFKEYGFYKVKMALAVEHTKLTIIWMIVLMYIMPIGPLIYPFLMYLKIYVKYLSFYGKFSQRAMKILSLNKLKIVGICFNKRHGCYLLDNSECLQCVNVTILFSLSSRLRSEMAIAGFII